MNVRTMLLPLVQKACLITLTLFGITLTDTLTAQEATETQRPIPEKFRPIMQKIQQRVQQGPHTQVDIKRSALLLIEFQGEWLNQDGKLRPLMQDSKQFESAIQNAKLALQAARKSGMPVIHAGIQFQPGHPELSGGFYGLRGIQPITNVFVSGTRGSQFVPPFTPSKGEFVPTGRTGGSAFSGSNLDKYLRNNGITTLYLIGFASNVCVESTMRDAHDRGYHVIILGDATATFTPSEQQDFLRGIHHFGYKMSSADYVKRLESQANRAAQSRNSK